MYMLSQERRIWNIVKHLRWSFFEELLMTKSIPQKRFMIDVLQGSK